MRKYLLLILISCLCTAYTFSIYTFMGDNEVPYPEGYRNWTHIKTAVIGPNNPVFKRFGGFHHIYANDKAMEGYRTGKFPEGSVIVFDLIEAINKDGDIEQGNRRHVDVMIKDSSKYDSTGGWGFEEFEGNSKTNRTIKQLAGTQCFSCHAKQKNADFVFSKYRE